jgi:hypothetical protein
MNRYNGKTTIAKDNAKTKDIIEALCSVVPIAIDQCKGEVEKVINKTGNPLIDAESCCRYIRNNVKYKADGFSEQNIQLPGRMFSGTKQADCKSLSLGFIGMMGAMNYNCGFRFASYRSNKIPTHVYNFVICNGKKYTFDACVESLKESPRYTYIKDMKVQYLSGLPIMGNDFEYMGGKEERRARRAKRREEGKGGTGKKILLAPVRAAFLSLVGLNVRGIAKKLSIAIAKDPSTTKSFWEKLGGKYDRLKSRVEKSKDKRPLAGESRRNKELKGLGFYPADTEDSYIGVVDLAAIGVFLATAAPALIAAKNLFKKNGIPEGEEGEVITSDEEKETETLPKGFEAADPEGGSSLTTGFKASPLLIGGVVGGLALIYFLTKKKK